MGYKSAISKYALIVSILVWPTLIVALMYYNEVTVFSLTPSGYTLWAYLVIIIICAPIITITMIISAGGEKDEL